VGFYFLQILERIEREGGREKISLLEEEKMEKPEGFYRSAATEISPWGYNNKNMSISWHVFDLPPPLLLVRIPCWWSHSNAGHTIIDTRKNRS